MSKQNFTPGPWKWEPGSKTIRSVPANYWLATMDSWDGQVNNDANARLIAAAPALYAALEDLLSAGCLIPLPATHDGLTVADALAKARSAIALVDSPDAETGAEIASKL